MKQAKFGRTGVSICLHFTLFTFIDKHQRWADDGKRESDRGWEKKRVHWRIETISAKILFTRFRRTNKWMNTQWMLWKHFVEVKKSNRMRPSTIRIQKCPPVKTQYVWQRSAMCKYLFHHFNGDSYVQPKGRTVSFRFFHVFVKTSRVFKGNGTQKMELYWTVLDFIGVPVYL